MESRFGMVLVILLLTLASAIEARPGGAFDITSFSAKSDGRSDVSQAVLKAWNKACTSPQSSSVVIPRGTYLLNPVFLQGPCKAPIEFNIQGKIVASEDHKIFKADGWITFHNIDRFTLTGGGIFDAKGSKTWNDNKCHKTASCDAYPISLMFNAIRNSVVHGITLKDSKFFHINVIGSSNFTFHRVRISAPAESKNTDGIHIGRSNGVYVTDSIIQTGDDCISLGDGSKEIRVTNVTCGPGHGISIGSLGRYPNEEPVDGVYVRNCTLINTTNGVRIKTWPGSRDGIANDLHFNDIIMNNVANPILVDQEYCPHYHCKQGQPSNIKLTKVSFHNIRGTSAYPLAIILLCSKRFPCDTMKFGDIDLKYKGPLGPITTKCSNIKPKFKGVQNPKICSPSTPKVNFERLEYDMMISGK